MKPFGHFFNNPIGRGCARRDPGGSELGEIIDFEFIDCFYVNRRNLCLTGKFGKPYRIRTVLAADHDHDIDFSGKLFYFLLTVGG